MALPQINGIKLINCNQHLFYQFNNNNEMKQKLVGLE